MTFIIDMAFIVGCATLVLVTAILKETPVSVSIGKEFHFSTGNQDTCPEQESDNFE